MQQVIGMIDIPEDGSIDCDISAVIFEGLSVTTPDGRPAMLAIVDENGQVVEAGNAVAQHTWNTVLGSYRNFLIGQGHIRVHTKPPGDPRQ